MGGSVGPREETGAAADSQADLAPEGVNPHAPAADAGQSRPLSPVETNARLFRRNDALTPPAPAAYTGPMRLFAPFAHRRWTKKHLMLAAGIVILAGALTVLFFKAGVLEAADAVILQLRQAGPVAFFLALAVLPSLGVPLMPFTLVAGPAFGPSMGLGAVVLCTIASVSVNVALSYWLASRLLRPSIIKLAHRLGYQLPTPSGSWHLAAVMRLAPGLPFFAQSYVLGLIRVPFGSYMAASVLVPAGYISGIVLLGDAIWQVQGRTFFLAICILLLTGTILHFLRTRRFGTASQIPSDANRAA
jgi:uncharacterized membrane protein YdjX (TVP38/TMEM64 family)